ncbi:MULTISPECIES: lytic transglycosylase domain-containing protein [Marivita]|uniref:Transglycosylase SLT domain-containing protein n=1 Tax=Marivita cryptomonadis TaxID=505252 RepID=A0A9Q2S5Y5_9RHOB|nr:MULTISPECIES: lytic transglycosylase domain-containing protein [Marivita]MCR9170053.1 hypothetical protein [Paracoccaceae bacterium]MBM2322654.1 hypothetical protein [Marivita cryptomonadis]MBM2332236.1 hypothetical protein [Marivita cryptomonadis]MBM2341820.1 hypothetical protein [Marivita cryptomonadis]MBM2346484.1 hypothetical protein [Marivita cryptomonadis]
MSGFGAFASGMAGGIHGGLSMKRRKEELDLMRDLAVDRRDERRAALEAGSLAPAAQSGGTGGAGQPRSMRAVAAWDGPVPVDFSQYEAQYELPSGYLQRTAQLESSMGRNMKNPNSSATGPFQFIKSTAKQYGLTDPMDWTQSTDAASRLARDNSATLTRALGRAPTAAELYLAHQQGGGGAAQLLANPTAPAASIVGKEAVRLNGGSLDMTAQEFAGLWLNKFGGPTPSRAPTQSQPAPQQTPPMPADTRPRSMTAYANLNGGPQ